MAILEKEVWVGLGGKGAKHYESLGYEIPRVNGKIKQGTKILVKIEDLPKNSGTKVTKVCDIKGCNKQIPNQSFEAILKRRNLGDGKDRCSECSVAIRIEGRKRNIKFERTLQFWAKENNKEYLLDEFSLKNNISPDKIFKSSTEVCWWECHKCKGEYKMTPHQRTNGNQNCPYCVGKRALVRYSDLFTTHPHIAESLVVPERGYELTAGSGKKEDFICSDCGFIVCNRKIADVVNKGFQCPRCGDGISFPEKILFNVLNQLGIEFETQKRFDWSNGKKYDFFIAEFGGCIIEAHGLQHYEGGFERKRGRSLIEEQENDTFKKELAIVNGINHYIIIDCRRSDLRHIKKSILSSNLSLMFNLNNINWINCHENACKNIVKTICELWNAGNKDTSEIGKILKIDRATVINNLKKGVELNWCNYNPKKSYKISGKTRSKPICQLTVENNFIREWNSAAEACESLNIASSHITSVCKGNRKSAYGFRWIYKEDYEKLIETIQTVGI